MNTIPGEANSERIALFTSGQNTIPLLYTAFINDKDLDRTKAFFCFNNNK